jgi:hypothetical protein
MHAHGPSPLVMGLLIASALLIVALYATGAVARLADRAGAHGHEGDDGRPDAA